MSATETLATYLSRFDQIFFEKPAAILNTRVLPRKYIGQRPVQTVYGKCALPGNLVKHLKFLDEIEEDRMIYLIFTELLEGSYKTMVTSDDSLWGLAWFTVWERVMTYMTIAGKHSISHQATSHEYIARAARGADALFSVDSETVKKILWDQYDQLLRTPGWKEYFMKEARRVFPDDEEKAKESAIAQIWDHAEIGTIMNIAALCFLNEEDRIAFMIRCKEALFDVR